MTAEGTCKGCGNPLKRMKWNSDTDIVVCDSSGCRQFHTPIWAGGKTTKETKAKVPEWLRGSDDDSSSSSFTARLQGLRENIFSKD